MTSSILHFPFMEPPECPVCLSAYDGAVAIPRVLACGHSVCETCLLRLPRRFPHAIRCPACTQLVNYPHSTGGVAALPKNIDLLRISTASSSCLNKSTGSNAQRRSHVSSQCPYFVPSSWSDQLYSAWKHWILPTGAVSLTTDPNPEPDAGFLSALQGQVFSSCCSSSGSSATTPCFCFLCCLKGDRLTSLVRVGPCASLHYSVFDYGHVVRIMNCVGRMKEKERAELGLILRACSSQIRVCDSFGLWYNLEDSCVYLACVRHGHDVPIKFSELERRFQVDGDVMTEKMDSVIADELLTFGIIGMELCEAVISLHSVGLIAGCLSLSCFQSDNLGRSYVDLNTVLVTGRMVRKFIEDSVAGLQRVNGSENASYVSDILHRHVFVSPEVFLELLHKMGVVSERGSPIHSFGSGSDSWSLSCLLLHVLIGKAFVDLLLNYMQGVFQSTREDNGLYCLCWMDKVTSLLEAKIGSKYVQLRQILVNSLHFDPKLRPPIIDVWNCIRGLIIKSQYGDFISLESTVEEKNTSCCMVLGDLCKFTKKSINELETRGGGIELQVGEMSGNKDLFPGLSAGKDQVKKLQGHLDCITGLAVGGGFLLSSSFDKTVRVWSLQDFSLVHSFRGHQHRVMAVVFVEEEEPFCISGDSGGGIFVWDISSPLKQEPRRNWYEQKDWRYSGIHALAVSGSQYLYTGSGDKLIKAWSLQDYTLSSTMSGHRSVVSTLAVSGGVLYSGSWDGTIRLWSLNDHTPLTVLEDDAPRNPTPVLCLTADQHLLVAAYEDGIIKIWKNDVAMRSKKLHDGSIFTIGMAGKWLFTGGQDKTLNVQEFYLDEYGAEANLIGSISCDAVVTALCYWRGWLFVGFADTLIKVHYNEE